MLCLIHISVNLLIDILSILLKQITRFYFIDINLKMANCIQPIHFPVVIEEIENNKE